MKAQRSRDAALAFLRCLPACLCAAVLPAAQTAAQVVRTPAEVPPATELAPRPRLPATDPSTLPEPAPQPSAARALGKRDDEFTIDVTAYAVDADAPAALRAALPRLTAPYVGAGRSYEDLSGAVAEVTRFLQRDVGDYLGYAYLPEQQPSDGVVRIAVLEGRLDRVVLDWKEGLPVRRSVVESYLARLAPGTILRVRDLERVVFLVNDLRGITARFEITAGRRPGTATLVVTPSAEPRQSARVDFDLNGSRYLGLARLGGLVSVNSPLGRGDAFTVTGLTSLGGGLSFALAGYSTPVGGSGLKLGASLSAVRYRLDPSAFPLDVNGSATIATGYGLYPWIRSRNLNLFMVGSFDRRDYTDRIAALTTQKSIDSLSLGLTGDFRDSLLSGAVSTYEASIARGRLRYTLGAPPPDNAPSYTRTAFAFTRLQNVRSNRLLLYLALRGQWALDNLDTTEQFRAGGPDGVRAFAPGEGTGDSGALGTAELRLLPPDGWFGRTSREIVFGAFYDAGRIKHRQHPDAAGSTDNVRNWAGYAGAGLSAAWVRSGRFALRASLARPLVGEQQSDPRGLRLYLQFNWSLL